MERDNESQTPEQLATKSPFDVPAIRTRATTEDILDALRESRERG